MTRASDLHPGQMILDRVAGSNATDGAYGSVMLSNFPTATMMRAGNTPQERDGSEWRPYAAESFWPVRSGVGLRTVFAEFQTSGGVVQTSAVVPSPAAADQCPMPISDAIQPPDLGGNVFQQDFAAGFDRWVSYDYNGGLTGGGNVFYPASHDSDGFIWTDDSRWRIDTPESPDSILALLTYPRWHNPAYSTLYIYPKDAQFDLRGVDLDLKGGQAFWWVVDANGRYYNTGNPLTVVNGSWTANSVLNGPLGGNWTQSWAVAGPVAGPLLDKVISFGIGFTGFPLGNKPTGRLEMRNFRIG